MKKFWYKLKARFLTIFGDIKIFRWPLFLVYDPSDYEITGEEKIEVLRHIKPGDVVIRGYNHYLDGKFIPSKHGWSHAGVYIGNYKVIHAVAEGVSEINILDFMNCDRILVMRPLNCVDIGIERAKRFLKERVPYDFGFNNGISALYCFELAAECYKELRLEKKKVSLLKGLIKRKDPVYLAESFIESDDFLYIALYNKKYGQKFIVDNDRLEEKERCLNF